MDEIKDYLNEKKILTILFPGFVATYPLLLVLVKFILNQKNVFSGKDSLPEIFGVGLLIFIFVFFYGIGFFIKRLAIRSLERILDNRLEKLLQLPAQASSTSTFDAVWYQYLSKKIGTGDPPLIDFYNTYIQNYHFDQTCILAMLCQLFFMWILDGTYYHLFPMFWKIFITSLYALIIVWLASQLMTSSKELHRLRERIINLP